MCVEERNIFAKRKMIQPNQQTVDNNNAWTITIYFEKKSTSFILFTLQNTYLYMRIKTK